MVREVQRTSSTYRQRNYNRVMLRGATGAARERKPACAVVGMEVRLPASATASSSRGHSFNLRPALSLLPSNGEGSRGAAAAVHDRF